MAVSNCLKSSRTKITNQNLLPNFRPIPARMAKENSGVFTETLARIYIKQGKYQRAYEIISRLHQQHPDKNGYYVDQLRFLEKLMLNSKKK